MILSFADNETEKIFYRQFSRKLPEAIQKIARCKLIYIDSAATIQDLRIPPGNRLEQLQGAQEGQFSIRINNQWRIVFKWKNGNAYQVTIVDYHA